MSLSQGRVVFFASKKSPPFTLTSLPLHQDKVFNKKGNFQHSYDIFIDKTEKQ